MTTLTRFHTPTYIYFPFCIFHCFCWFPALSRCLNVGLPGGCHEWRGARAALPIRLVPVVLACTPLICLPSGSIQQDQPRSQAACITTHNNSQAKTCTGPQAGQPPKYPCKQGIGPLASRIVNASAAALVMHLT